MLRHALGFLIASLVQAAIAWMAQIYNIWGLDLRGGWPLLLAHILIGQVAGFVLLGIFRKVVSVAQLNPWFSGPAYGSGLGVVVQAAAWGLGAVRAPWTAGFWTIALSLVAFMVYGALAAVTIKWVEYRKVWT